MLQTDVCDEKEGTPAVDVGPGSALVDGQHGDRGCLGCAWGNEVSGHSDLPGIIGGTWRHEILSARAGPALL